MRQNAVDKDGGEDGHIYAPRNEHELVRAAGLDFRRKAPVWAQEGGGEDVVDWVEYNITRESAKALGEDQHTERERILYAGQ